MLAPSGLGVGVTGARHGRDEDLGLAGSGAVHDGHGHAGVVDLQALAGGADAAQGRRPAGLLPLPEMMTELGQPVAGRMLDQILQPQQFERHPAAPQFFVHGRPVGRRTPGVAVPLNGKQGPFQGVVAQALGFLPGDARLGRPGQVFADRRATDPGGDRDLPLIGIELELQTQNFSYPPHVRPRPRHRHLPCKGRDNSHC